MAGDALQLFLDRFKIYNAKRYAGNQYALNVINAITLEQIQFSDWVETDIKQGQVKQKVNMTVPNIMSAGDQEYFSLDFSSPLVSTPTKTSVISEQNLTKQPEGVYLYKANTDSDMLSAAIVVQVKDDLYSEGLAIIKAACKFDLTDDNFTKLEDDGSMVIVRTKAFASILTILQQQLTKALYDGTYKYDGSLTY